MFSIRVDRRDGQGIVELTPISESIRFSTASIGGFSSCSFSLAPRDWSRIPHLATVKLYWGGQMLWEGRVEDKSISIQESQDARGVSCYGYFKLLEESSVRRIWSLRSIPWRPNLNISGLAQVGGNTPTLDASTLFVTVGQFDPSDLSRVGVLCDNVSGIASTVGDASWAVYIAPEDVEITRLLAHISRYGTSPNAFVQTSVDGSSWTLVYGASPADEPGEDKDWALASGTRYIVLGTCVPTSGNNKVTFEDMRILGTQLTEDKTGGFYGHTLINDLISLVPELTPRVIEESTDFVLMSLARTARDSVLSVVQEVSSFYTHEWGVWEDRAFDWKAASKDEPHWVIPLSKLQALDLTSSVDGLVKSVYMIYDDAATAETKESVEDSVDARNPYVRYTERKDLLLSAPTVMLSNSADRLAARVVLDRGGAPIARGRLSIGATTMVRHADGSSKPAMFIRGGDNVVLPDVPVDHYFRPSPGGDGQTLFHVRSTETDMSSMETSLELDAFAHSSDVIMARVAAVTRAITGS